MPKELYILRMNPMGTMFFLEMRELAQYPRFDILRSKIANSDGDITAAQLRELGFGELMGRMRYPQRMDLVTLFSENHDDFILPLSSQKDPGQNTLCTRVLSKRIDITIQEAGEERMADFGLDQSALTKELIIAQNNLKKYYDCVDSAEQYLRIFDQEYIRHQRSLDNIDFCSISDTFLVYGRPFLKMCFRLGHRFRSDAIFTEYDVPNWKIEFIHDGGQKVFRRNESREDNKSFDDWMKVIIQEPVEASAKRKQIIGQIDDVFGIQVEQNGLLYDPTSDCFLLKEETEMLILDELMPKKAGEVERIAKYTTFETLISILQSGKIRMNSIVSMNDKTETDFLENVFRNFKEEYEQEYDKYLFADKEFITSFTTRIDDLDMWRLYGDNARGACLVFERNRRATDGLFKINYINPEGNILIKISDFLLALKDKDIKFRWNLLQKYRHYLKHSDYETEDEYRLLVTSDDPDGWFINRDNGILTPYLEREIKKSGKPAESDYPYKLNKIILGPAIQEKHVNLMQVFYLIHQYGFFLSVEESKIISYR